MNVMNVVLWGPQQHAFADNNPMAHQNRIPIPRAQDDEIPQHRARATRQHVGRACEPCRVRKQKCTGEQGGCDYCTEYKLSCSYSPGRREKLKRQQADSEANARRDARTLDFLCSRNKISQAELQACRLLAADAPSEEGRPTKRRRPNVDGTTSPGATEDLNRGGLQRATGFFGDSSEVVWLQELAGGSISENSYHLDSPDLPAFETQNVDFRPPLEAVQRLSRKYIDRVHPSFPIINIPSFLKQTEGYYRNPAQQLPTKWLVVLNLVLAIGARYYALVTNKEKRDAHDVYFGRASLYGLENRTLHHPDIQQMQIHGLASFYLLATGHLNRAWRLCSDAVREAISLGIHLEIIGPCLSGLSKETRYHIWWSLCTLEHRLSVMTGRPCLTAHDVGTVPMPAPFDGRHFPTAECSQVPIPENQNSSYKVAKPNNVGSNPSPLYFVELARLISRARKMMSNLYSPAGMQQPPSIQRRIMVDLVNELDTWSTDLPKELDISATLKADGPLAWQRRSLSVHYYSTMVAMTRPSLDLPVLRQGDERAREPSQTPRDLATECVDSAIHVIRLLTDGAQDPAALRKESPWWCVLHFLVQATAVLGIEMQYSCRHVGRGRANMIKQSAFRALAWLLELSKDGDESAGKAWQKYEPLISRHSAGLPADTTVQNRDPGEKVDRKSTATPDPTSQPSQSGPAQPNNPTDTPFLGESPPGCMVPIDTPAGLTQQETLNNLYLSPWPTTVDEPDSFTSNYHDRTADNDDYQNDVDSYGSYSN